MSDDKSLEDYALAGADIQQITQLSRQISKVKTERDIFKGQVKELEEALDESELRSHVLTHLSEADYKPPTWLTKKRKKSTGVVCTILSDTHFDEVVKPEEIQFRNEYNREIAVKRLEAYFQKIILLTNSKTNIIGIDGFGLKICGVRKLK